MRDSILRVIDDLSTKSDYFKKAGKDSSSAWTRAFFDGHSRSLEYAIRELRKVVDDYAVRGN